MAAPRRLARAATPRVPRHPGAWLALGLVVAVALPATAGDRVGMDAWKSAMRAGLQREAEADWAAADAHYAEAATIAVEAGLDAEYREAALLCREACLMRLQRVLDAREVEGELLTLQPEDPRRIDRALTVAHLAYHEAVLGDGAAAHRHLENVRGLLRADDEPVLVGEVLTYAADAAFRTGHHAAALRAAQQAIEALAGAQEDGLLARALLLRGAIESALGEGARARRSYLEALEVTPDEASRIDLLLGLALLEVQLDRWADARQHLEQARAGAEARGDAVGAAWSELGLATVLHVEEKHAKAHEILVRLEKRLPGETSFQVARQLLEGRIHRAQGQSGEARRALAAALEHARALSAPLLVMEAATAWAELELDDGHPVRAKALLEEALDASARQVRGLPALRHMRASDGRGDLFDAAKRLAFALPRPTETFDLLERTRAGVLLDALTDPDGGGTTDGSSADAAQLARTREALRDAAMQLQAAQRNGRLGLIRSAEEAYEAARTAYRSAFEDARLSRARGLARLQRTPEPLSSLEHRLDPDTAYVAYGLVGEELCALVVRRGGTRIARVRRASEGGLLGAIRALKDGAARPDGAIRREAARAWLLDPLELPETVRRVVVSPDGAIAQVPFRLLDESRSYVFVPSATAWRLMTERRPEEGERLLAVGIADYADDEAAHLLSPNAERLGDLPHAREEVEAILRAGDARLLDERATEAAVRAALAGASPWRAVHFACHGLVADARPAWSSLALRAAADDDGYLTVLEILELRVRTRLVVLSACRSAVGRSMNGEGLLGLSSAFLYSGASTLVANLWKVDDEAARALMRRFHALWRPASGEGLGVAEALRQAQEHVRTTEDGRWAQPAYWAGWVVWGLPD